MESIVREGSLGSILFKCQIISEDDIAAALAEQERTGCRFGEALVALGIVAQEDIDWALSNQLNIPYVRLKPAMFDPQAAELVPAALARQHNLIPLIRAGDELSIAIADPLNLNAVTEIERLTGCSVTVSVALIREIREMQDLFYGAATTAASLGFTSANFPPNAVAAINEDLSGGKLLDYLLLFILQQKLASLSLQPLPGTVAVVGRRGGVTREIGRLAPEHYPEFVQRAKKLAHLGGIELAGRGELAFTWKGKTIPFQVALLRSEAGEQLTFKMQVAVPFPGAVADLGLSAEKLGQLEALLALGRGLLVVAAREPELRQQLINLYLQERDTTGKTVMVLGDGPGRGESRFPRVAVPRHADLGVLVPAALEHDPDILAVEEVADGQGFAATCRAVLRGKLVIAGTPFADLAGTFKHLLAFRDRLQMIPLQPKGIVVCRGVRLLCPDCREQGPLAAEDPAGLAGITSCRPVGCPTCDQTGYRGKRYLLELIVFDDELRKRFVAAHDDRELLDYLRGTGWRSIVEEGKELLAAGEISLEDYQTAILT